MFSSYNYTAASRFMRYVQVDTQSDPQATTFPSTEKQKNLGKVLVDELLQMGINDAHLDEYGYVYATLPSNTSKQLPVICFCAHMDTAPDCSGTDVKPILHKNYQGQELVLPDDTEQKLTIEKYPYLQKCIGHDIITASGKTLLGADDKAGVAIVMDLVHFLSTHPEVKHGTIKILFTPDEEVGRGTAHVDINKLGAQYGYTLDGGAAGDLEDETFSADGVVVTIHGIIAHPGAAKGKMVNALKIAGEFLAALPKNELSPETTEGRNGFFHPVRVEGIAEKAVVEFIIRDFVTAGLATKEDGLKNIVTQVVAKHPGASFDFEVREQYRNMKEVLDTCPQVIDYARQAINRAGLNVRMESIRGGTDGSRLSFMGLPSPNVFTGMQAIHSLHEFICVQDMHKSVETLVHLASIWEEQGA